MNVNGSRFHLLLGEADWGSCASAEGKQKPLARLWKLPGSPDPLVPAFDKERRELILAPQIEAIPDTPGELRFTSAHHRDSAADRNGNLYYVADDRAGLMVRSAGSGKVTGFWPVDPAASSRPASFSDAAPAPPDTALFTAVAVTMDDYLIAARGGNGGGELLRFDLVGGGAPDTLPLADGMVVASLAPALGGGAWLLDSASGQLLRLDRDLRPATRPVPGEVPAFAPDGAEPAAAPRGEAISISTAAAPAAIAIAGLADGSLVLLDAPADRDAGLFILEPGDQALRALIRLDFRAFCFAAEGEAESPAVMLGDIGGNRARKVELVRRNGIWQAVPEPDTLPLRRFGGRALVPILGVTHYDSGVGEPLWVPVVERPHRAFASGASFVTPIRDSGEPQCEWDRIRLDACIPPGTSVRVEARAADSESSLAGTTAAGWIEQPALYFCAAGVELPGKRAIAVPVSDARAGRGCWEVLLQGVTGRFAQLRVHMAGDERITPRLRALRLWYPRFSYVERFLPAVYREDAASGSFLTRFLANPEGLNTFIEDRIASGETLLDPRTAPVGMLEWLAGWYDVALDAGWDEGRRRLFLAHAAEYFGWRGTPRGLRVALKLALDLGIDARDFDFEAPECVDPAAIRIVESFQQLPSRRSFAPNPAGAARVPSGRSLSEPWSPEEGSAGLWARWDNEGGAPNEAGRFPLYAREDVESGWAAFCETQFGFVPAAGASERSRWQAYLTSLGYAEPLPDLPDSDVEGELRTIWLDFTALPAHERLLWQDHLRLRYRSIERLQAAYAAPWQDFAEIPIPDTLPDNEQAIRDWLIFEGQRLPREGRAHRFSVLLPRIRVDSALEDEAVLLAQARRIVEVEKPAHTRFDIRFYWAMNRIGDAKLGLDTSIGQGSRAPELIPGAVLGRAYTGAAFIGGPASPPKGRERIAC
jgi:phage tail-like protein